MKAGNMEISTCVVGPIRTNCYVLINEDSKECIIVDPGDQAMVIETKIETDGLKPVAVLLTHGHFDHILAVKDIASAYGIPVYANEEEQDVLLDGSLNLSTSHLGTTFSFDASNYLRDGEKVTLAGFAMEAIATPGHTKGCMCYYFKEENVLVSGDTLFRETVGRTDLPTSSTSKMIHSVTEKLKQVAEEAIVLPGHGETSTMGYERKYNPYLEG
ncbi:MBL fold metallo-hydrolase [Anaerosporobacter sp.]|uniref:MBL fold metallo-hydrolase n=1 Tax=Anaerosporobacter sp. TaxID=1872529 RepID=UPI00286FABF1|nr:MBL fold metallo-hydrolase [Anaerosporobacter sp.]